MNNLSTAVIVILGGTDGGDEMGMDNTRRIQ